MAPVVAGLRAMITVMTSPPTTLVLGLVISSCASPRIGGMSLRSWAEADDVTRPATATANMNCPKRFIDMPPIIESGGPLAASW